MEIPAVLTFNTTASREVHAEVGLTLLIDISLRVANVILWINLGWSLFSFFEFIIRGELIVPNIVDFISLSVGEPLADGLVDLLSGRSEHVIDLCDSLFDIVSLLVDISDEFIHVYVAPVRLVVSDPAESSHRLSCVRGLK